MRASGNGKPLRDVLVKAACECGIYIDSSKLRARLERPQVTNRTWKIFGMPKYDTNSANGSSVNLSMYKTKLQCLGTTR